MISVESLHRNYDASEELCNTKEGRNEKDLVFLGIRVTSLLSPSPLSAFGVRSRYVTIPKQPIFIQKIIAFLLVQGKVARFARREGQYVDYAYSWSNARDIFGW